MIFGIDIKIILAVVSSVIAVVWGYGPYFIDIFKKRTQPHAYSWFIWIITQGTVLAGIVYGNGGWGALWPAIGTILITVVFLFSLKYGTKNITKSDTIILILALLATGIWWGLDSPFWSVFAIILIDLFGYIPTIRKTYLEPWTETPTTWGVFAAANILTIMALTEYNFLTLAYLVAITVANVILLWICLHRRKIIPISIV